MAREKRSLAGGIARGVLLLSGWIAAGWLGYTSWQRCEHQDALAPLVPTFSAPVRADDAPVPPQVTPSSSDSQTSVVPPAVPQVAPPPDPLQVAFQKWSAQTPLKGVILACCVLDEQGKVLFSSPLAETALCPASALKTVTSGAALDLLGPEFRFITEVRGNLNDKGVVEGDLILVGSGDPTLEIADLDQLASDLVKRGVKRIEGRVIADAHVFPEAAVSDHWNWGDIGNAYGAGTYGINLEHNTLQLRFAAGAKEGDAAKLMQATPNLEKTGFKGGVTTGPEGSGDQVTVYSHPYASEIALTGSVPLGDVNFTVRGAIPNPPALTVELLQSRLTKAGVKIAAKTVITEAPPTAVLATCQSPPLPEIIDHLHDVSDNLEAQCLFLTLGNLQKQDPVAALQAYWQKAGVQTQAWRLLDGNGLARANMIRPIDLARINFTARHAKYGERFFQSLKRYDGGTTHAKLGAMSGVKTEVGFITLVDGRELTFCLMANGLTPGTDYWPLRTQWLDTVKRQAGKR